MLKIAVCDDDREMARKISKIISQFFIDKNIEVKIKLFFDGNEILLCNIKFDLIFLDIEMKELNGIETAKKIRVFDFNVPIIYITGYSNYWRSAYQIHAFDYIEKPIEETRLYNILFDFMRFKEKKNQEMISLKIEHGTKLQDMDEIYYFLINRKKRVIVKTLLEEYTVMENLSDIYKKVDKVQFYIPHRSCIVNLHYVDYLKNCDIYLENGEWLPLAQKKRKEFLMKINEFVYRNERGK